MTAYLALAVAGLAAIAVCEGSSWTQRPSTSVLQIRGRIAFPDRRHDRGLTGLLESSLRFGRQQEPHKCIRFPGVFGRSRNQGRILDRIAHIDARRAADDSNVVALCHRSRIINHPT